MIERNFRHRIIIRKAEEKDRQVFIEMEKEFCKYYRDLGFNKHLKPVSYEYIPESYFVNSFNELLSGDNFFYVAEEDGKVVGYIEAEIVEPYEKDLYKITKSGHINSIFVFENYRSKGIGSNLMNEAIKWMKSEGVQICTLGVVHGNDEAMASYQKLGFSTERTKMWKQI